MKHLISPQIQILVDYLSDRGEGVTEQVVGHLKSIIGDKPPHLWRTNLCANNADAVSKHLRSQKQLTLGELIRDPYNLEKSIACITLAIQRGDERIMLPEDNEALYEDDEILFCGTQHSETMLSASMNNAYTLHYLITGIDAPRGYFFQWLEGLRNAKTVTV